MSKLRSPTWTPVISILACVQCAKSKAKCDRKVPCSRCRLKKLTCKTRVPRRGCSSAKDKAKASTANKNPNTVNSEPVISTTVDGGPLTAPPYPTGNGLYMNWSHSAGHKWAQNCPTTTLEEDQAYASLPRSVEAASRFDETYPLDLSCFSQFMQPAISGTIEDSYFVLPTRVPSPPIQLPDISGMPLWNLPCNIFPGMLSRSTIEDGEDISKDCLS